MKGKGMFKRIFTALFICFQLAIVLPVSAQDVSDTSATANQANGAPIPVELLEVDYQRCMKGCLPGFDQATCHFLCNCTTVQEFPKRMAFERYIEISSQMAKDELEPQNRALLDDIAQYCAAEFKESGIVVGPPEVRQLPEPTDGK